MLFAAWTYSVLNGLSTVNVPTVIAEFSPSKNAKRGYAARKRYNYRLHYVYYDVKDVSVFESLKFLFSQFILLTRQGSMF